jgi:phosphoribosylformylglycinamidine (FGAM) synthase-like enzyme
VLGTVAGRPPALDLDRERALHLLLIEAAGGDLLASAHDCGDGGLAIALAESAMAGDHGFAVSLPGDVPSHVTLFSESASRAVVSVQPGTADALETLARQHSVPCVRIGETGGPRMVFGDLFEATLEEARAAFEGAIPKLLAG